MKERWGFGERNEVREKDFKYTEAYDLVIVNKFFLKKGGAYKNI